ncbi:hypothetical protein BV898_10910 [Hypsibius exemplaris]|uniref:Uncharacterized protein n=1 Tax=Hypsibius exemplaris TaxID=2072580 RepID=A0A1W0WI43_HYPEX|nr:hypothetical protein BV898_10910 [Hypsibius exemplaris]
MSNFLEVIPLPSLRIYGGAIGGESQESSGFLFGHYENCSEGVSELEEVKRLEMWNKQKSLDHETFHTPELYALWNQKLHFLMEAIKENPFDSDYFLWTDIGSFRDKEQAEQLTSYPDTNTTATLLGTDKVFFLQMGDFLEEHRKIRWNGLPEKDFQHGTGLAGTVLGGHANAIREYNQRYYETMKLMHDNGLFIGKDQNIMSTVAVLYPDLHSISAFFSICPPSHAGNLRELLILEATKRVFHLLDITIQT